LRFNIPNEALSIFLEEYYVPKKEYPIGIATETCRLDNQIPKLTFIAGDDLETIGRDGRFD